MNRTVKEMAAKTWAARFRAGLALTAVAGMLLAAAGSQACAVPGGGKSVVFKMPPQEPASDGDWKKGGEERSIVGLWHTVYTATGAPPTAAPFLESLKTWHGDGTEFENAVLPPIGGNVCVGVWKEVGERKVKLHHTGLMFTPDADPTKNVLSATFTVDETDEVAEDGKTYKGSFTFAVFDLNGKKLQTVTGTIAATRISVD
jgi:hypothetical protein